MTLQIGDYVVLTAQTKRILESYIKDYFPKGLPTVLKIKSIKTVNQSGIIEIRHIVKKSKIGEMFFHEKELIKVKGLKYSLLDIIKNKRK